LSVHRLLSQGEETRFLLSSLTMLPASQGFLARNMGP
jgi:hypothetical protein